MQKDTPFRIYVTHVDGEDSLLRLTAQLDRDTSCMIETLISLARDNLEKGIGSVPATAILEGILCIAKFKDGSYYRAKITNISKISSGLVGVHFIDYGNRDTISVSAIRFLDNYDPLLLKVPGQANDYYLSRIINPFGKWDEPMLLKICSMVANSERYATIDAHTSRWPIISIDLNGRDLSQYLANNRYGVSISIPKQEILILKADESAGQQPFQHIAYPNNNSYPEHVPFIAHQKFPSNIASAMRVQQQIMPSMPYTGNFSVPPPVTMNQRLMRTNRAQVNLKAPRHPQQSDTESQQVTSTSLKPQSPKKLSTYKSKLLEINTQHRVTISFCDEGPELFAVQLMNDLQKLDEMMSEINRRPHSSLTKPPMIGTVCLGRMSGERIICRAIVMNLSGSQCRLFFVDFGYTEMVSYYDIFDIPEEFIQANVYALRFCLSGVKKLNKSPHLNDSFKKIVSSEVLILRVVAPEGPPLIQYGELYLNNQNILEVLMSQGNENLQFKSQEMLPLGTKSSVLVSYVDNCLKFFVQLSDQIDSLNVVMEAVKAHCERSSPSGEPQVGSACCARFPDDGNWYRAAVKEINGSKVIVTYVDYGNEQEIDVSDLRNIVPELMQLPAQALKCALKGYENKSVETKSSNQLEMLALEKTLRAHIVGKLSNDTMLVSLVDESVSPPLDVAKKMMQLSQPRSNTEKASPLSRKEDLSFSSPEEDKRKNLKHERSFKDERRPRDEDFNRAGSFRGKERDARENFERKGFGRHSEKFGDKMDRGDSRRPKPWEKKEDNVVLSNSGDDQWEEHASIDAAPTKHFKDSDNNRFNEDEDRKERRPRQERWGGDKREERGGNWEKKEERGKWGEKREERGNWGEKREERGNWGEKREERGNWGEKREDRGNWGEKREDRGNRGERREDRGNWGDKRERGNQGEQREERGYRSNFTPKERADRSFGSNDSRSSKTRNFTKKELANPVPLDTPFSNPVIEPGSQLEVSNTWITSPHNFYTQILSLQPKFLDMMQSIPEFYKGVRSYSGDMPIGSSVLAKYPKDGVLYRATIVSSQPFGKYIVQYVDFGNKFLVDAKDIWQLDEKLMEVPKMAVHCSLVDVSPPDGEWKASPDVDLCFNAPRYQCVFHEEKEGQYNVSMWNNGVNVADTLVEKSLAVLAEQAPSVTLKDEAIDLTIIVGLQTLCRITHVESFDKFYVQLDIEKADLVEKAIANVDHSLLTPLSLDDISEGVHCTLKKDDKVYRAILNDISDLNNIQTILPDYGNTVTTTTANLMTLPSELTVYYYQSLQGSFNNYTEESNTLMTIEELKTTLEGNKCIIYINYVDGICLVSTLYDCKTGKKLKIFEPDEDAYEEVTPLCARSVFNYNFGLCYVSHVESLGEIYMQKSADSDRIAQLLDNMFKFYGDGTPENLESHAETTICAANSSDGNWYRATIVETAENECKVHFTDYGNSETLPTESLKKLDPEFYDPCALALAVGLGLTPITDDALKKIMEWTLEKEIQVTLTLGTYGWLASLHLDGVDLSMRLINENLATLQVDEAKVESTPEVTIPVECKQVYIGHIDSPGQFWLQMVDKIDKISEIQTELQCNATSYPDLPNNEIGSICVAKYSADDQWYRAEILDSDSDITTVRFIDYGNTDVLDNQPGLLKELPQNLKEIEHLCFKSSVNAVPSGTGQWSEPASDYFSHLVGATTDPLNALVVLKDITTYVDLFVNGENVTDKLVLEGHASKSEQTECGDLPSCFASHVNSPSEFWIQLEAAAPDLEAVESAMVDAENFPELTEKDEGVICAAKYPEDGAWYRAQVIVDGSQGTEVLFMDYGNASIATELRSLSEDLKTKPALSRKCALQKPRDIKWSRKAESRFNELAAEGATIFNVQFIASGDISIVELYHENKSVTEELVNLCDDNSERPTPLGHHTMQGKIVHVETLHEFYVTLDSNTDLEKVQEGLARVEEFDAVPELKVGTIYAGLWADDEQWYRAKVLELIETGAKVLFIDYGNKTTCEKFKQLPDDLTNIDPIAKCYSLGGDDSIEGKEMLNNLALDEANTFQIEIIDSMQEPNFVKLMLNGKIISELIDNTNSDKATVDDANVEDAELETDASKPDKDELNSSHTDLNESQDSNNTVIENKLELSSDNLENLKEDIHTENDTKNTNETIIITETNDRPDLIDSEELNDANELNKSTELNNSKELNEPKELNKSKDDPNNEPELNTSKESNNSKELNNSEELNESKESNKSKVDSDDDTTEVTSCKETNNSKNLNNSKVSNDSLEFKDTTELNISNESNNSKELNNSKISIDSLELNNSKEPNNKELNDSTISNDSLELNRSKELSVETELNKSKDDSNIAPEILKESNDSKVSDDSGVTHTELDDTVELNKIGNSNDTNGPKDSGKDIDTATEIAETTDDLQIPKIEVSEAVVSVKDLTLKSSSGTSSLNVSPKAKLNKSV